VCVTCGPHSLCTALFFIFSVKKRLRKGSEGVD
jgi:hypothetical protein